MILRSSAVPRFHLFGFRGIFHRPAVFRIFQAFLCTCGSGAKNYRAINGAIKRGGEGGGGYFLLLPHPLLIFALALFFARANAENPVLHSLLHVTETLDFPPFRH